MTQEESPTAARIRARWGSASNPLEVSVHKSGAIVPHSKTRAWNKAPVVKNDGTVSTYGASTVSNTNSDFLGDWRSVDSWQRFDMLRVRARSRQLERGNPWCRSFKISLINNVLGAKGFTCKPMVVSSRVFGDNSEGVLDEIAGSLITAQREEFEKTKNFTTRKRLSRKDADRLLLSRLVFDGEFIVRRITGFKNDFGFSWQIIDPDYLDHNLNRVEPNGNMTKMGVELDKEFKFPVAYWFLKKRPNDYFYNFAEMHNSLYYRVPAEEIFHVFMQTEDSEQTRGWPWLFAACINLFRMGKFEEAALVNATIGASKMGFFKKTVPDGFVGDPAELDDNGDIIDEVSSGTWQELPWNVEPVPWDPKYPDSEFEPFSKAMLRSISASLGCTYMSLSGDLSDANYAAQRSGDKQEHEQWMQIQDFMIDHWKEPEREEWLYRSLLSRKLPLPIGKVDKFKACKFTGRRWAWTNPVDDLNAKGMEVDLCVNSITHIIEENGGDRDEIFAQIAKDNKDMAALGIVRVSKNNMQPPDNGDDKLKPPKKKD